MLPLFAQQQGHAVVFGGQIERAALLQRHLLLLAGGGNGGGIVSSTAIQKTMKQRKAEVNAIRKARRRMEENIGKRPPLFFCQHGQREGILCAKEGRRGKNPAFPLEECMSKR